MLAGYLIFLQISLISPYADPSSAPSSKSASSAAEILLLCKGFVEQDMCLAADPDLGEPGDRGFP
jgi:hypothetical protein